MQLYVFWRAFSVPSIARRVPLAWLAAVGLLLWVVLVAARMVVHGSEGVVAAAVELAGLQVLHDRFVELRPGLVVAGVDDLTSRHGDGEGAAAVARALAGRPLGAAVLLSHTPWHAETAAAAGAGVMLCGHTHAGQVWPFGYLVRTVYPLLAGRYEVGGMTVIVGRGTGTWGPRMRLWRPAEIVRLTLRAGSAAR